MEALTLNARAASSCLAPARIRASASHACAGVSFLGRPNRTPRATALALPSVVRARISSRSSNAQAGGDMGVSTRMGSAAWMGLTSKNPRKMKE